MVSFTVWLATACAAGTRKKAATTAARIAKRPERRLLRPPGVPAVDLSEDALA
jgi:hypothetical protein